METNCDRRSQKKEKKNSCTRIFLYSRFNSLGDDNGSPSVIVDYGEANWQEGQKREKTRRRQDQMSVNLAEVINGMKEEK
jgi:hypothetical protein